jgi:hypothetical protein
MKVKTISKHAKVYVDCRSHWVSITRTDPASKTLPNLFRCRDINYFEKENSSPKTKPNPTLHQITMKCCLVGLVGLINSSIEPN